MSAIRFTALGDSSVEGWGAPAPNGGFHGWVPRVSTLLNLPSSSVRNLGLYGSTSQDVVDHQLPRVIANKSPLIGVVVGTNDLLRDYNFARLQRNLRFILDSLTGADTTVFTATLPDIPGIMPIPDSFRELLRARFAETSVAVQEAAAATGALCIETHRIPAWSDRAMWSDDNLHPSALGHQYFAEMVMEMLSYATGLIAA